MTAAAFGRYRAPHAERLRRRSPGRLTVRELLIFESLWLVGRNSQAFLSLQFVRLKIAFAPMHIGIAFKREDMSRQSVEEPPIVTDHDHTPGIIEDGFFKGPQRIDV